MTDQKSKQPANSSEVKQPEEMSDREIEQQSVMDVAQGEIKLDREQKAENDLAHEQNITAHIPGGGTIADVK